MGEYFTAAEAAAPGAAESGAQMAQVGGAASGAGSQSALNVWSQPGTYINPASMKDALVESVKPATYATPTEAWTGAGMDNANPGMLDYWKRFSGGSKDFAGAVDNYQAGNTPEWTGYAYDKLAGPAMSLGQQARIGMGMPAMPMSSGGNQPQDDRYAALYRMYRR
jgi:hypothetical protein